MGCLKTKDSERQQNNVPLCKLQYDSNEAHYIRNTPQSSRHYLMIKDKYNYNSQPERLPRLSLDPCEKTELEDRLKFMSEANNSIINDLLISQDSLDVNQILKTTSEIKFLITCYYSNSLSEKDIVSINHLLTCSSCEQCYSISACQGEGCFACRKLEEFGSTLRKIEELNNLKVKEGYRIEFTCQNKTKIRKRFLQTVKLLRKASMKTRRLAASLNLNSPESSEVHSSNSNFSIHSYELSNHNSVYVTSVDKASL